MMVQVEIIERHNVECTQLASLYDEAVGQPEKLDFILSFAETLAIIHDAEFCDKTRQNTTLLW